MKKKKKKLNPMLFIAADADSVARACGGYSLAARALFALKCNHLLHVGCKYLVRFKEAEQVV